MAVITIQNTGQKICCNDGDNLLRVLLAHGIFVDNPCNGTGVCGKCKVRIDGAGICLSCMTQVREELTIELLQKERKHRVLTKGYMPEFEFANYENGYGIAVDIGTTTVVMALIDLQTGEEIANASRINAQKQFGLDVLTRITYEYNHGEAGIQELQKTIVDSMNEMLEELVGADESLRNQIKEIVVAANCTMTHMLLGVDARSIGRAPYAPVFREAQECLASAIGLRAGEETKLYCLPQVSSYIGADIVAGAYVCELEKEAGNVLFIDIGTNGEIVLASKGKLLSCSCAAGPALEGMNISCGMRAAEGAIEDVVISEEGVQVKTIGDLEPVGLCGSGILAVVRELIQKGFLKKTGALIQPDSLKEDDWKRSVLRAVSKQREAVLCRDQEIIVTQDDIRQVQLAKGAILSGFTALLKKAEISMRELDKVLIAGQFGAHLPAESLVGVGILPEQVKEKLVYVGNSSKTGAYMALMSKKVRQEMELLAEKIEYFELAETTDYERVFAESMRFPVK
ncbi:MAG: DUF4445 domain-containing protein [Lachnospiraceae bacterium]|nr:DUF4445 domain-containing protein [Lachnospiraceae bacterium]